MTRVVVAMEMSFSVKYITIRTVESDRCNPSAKYRLPNSKYFSWDIFEISSIFVIL